MLACRSKCLLRSVGVLGSIGILLDIFAYFKERESREIMFDDWWWW